MEKNECIFYSIGTDGKKIYCERSPQTWRWFCDHHLDMTQDQIKGHVDSCKYLYSRGNSFLRPHYCDQYAIKGTNFCSGHTPGKTETCVCSNHSLCDKHRKERRDELIRKHEQKPIKIEGSQCNHFIMNVNGEKVRQCCNAKVDMNFCALHGAKVKEEKETCQRYFKDSNSLKGRKIKCQRERQEGSSFCAQHTWANYPREEEGPKVGSTAVTLGEGTCAPKEETQCIVLTEGNRCLLDAKNGQEYCNSHMQMLFEGDLFDNYCAQRRPKLSKEYPYLPELSMKYVMMGEWRSKNKFEKPTDAEKARKIIEWAKEIHPTLLKVVIERISPSIVVGAEKEKAKMKHPSQQDVTIQLFQQQLYPMSNYFNYYSSVTLKNHWDDEFRFSFVEGVLKTIHYLNKTYRLIQNAEVGSLGFECLSDGVMYRIFLLSCDGKHITVTCTGGLVNSVPNHYFLPLEFE